MFASRSVYDCVCMRVYVCVYIYMSVCMCGIWGKSPQLPVLCCRDWTGKGPFLVVREHAVSRLSTPGWINPNVGVSLPASCVSRSVIKGEQDHTEAANSSSGRPPIHSTA